MEKFAKMNSFGKFARNNYLNQFVQLGVNRNNFRENALFFPVIVMLGWLEV